MRLCKGRGSRFRFRMASSTWFFELGVLHHVKRSRLVVAEMMRVARKAVAMSDENRFAYGSPFGRWTKVFLWKLGLFDAFYHVVTGGKGYRFTEGDGVAYSHSVFDSINELSAWGDRMVMVTLDRNSTAPNAAANSTLFHPLMSSFRMMVVSIRDMHPELPKLWRHRATRRNNGEHFQAGSSSDSRRCSCFEGQQNPNAQQRICQTRGPRQACEYPGQRIVQRSSDGVAASRHQPRSLFCGHRQAARNGQGRHGYQQENRLADVGFRKFLKRAFSGLLHERADGSAGDRAGRAKGDYRPGDVRRRCGYRMRRRALHAQGARPMLRKRRRLGNRRKTPEDSVTPCFEAP